MAGYDGVKMTISKQQVKSKMHNKTRKSFSQVCVWPGVLLVDSGETTTDAITAFELFFATNFKIRVKYLREIKTFPDIDSNGEPISDTGGRNDVFFAVHDVDILRFAVPRLQLGIRWLEDVLSPENYRSPIYPEEVRELCSWDTEEVS
jgi:hypothetical protein